MKKSNVQIIVENKNAYGHWYVLGRYTVICISDIVEYEYMPGNYKFMITERNDDGQISYSHVGWLNQCRWRFNNIVYKPKTPDELIEFHRALESALIDEALK